jgi:hypothetical protein
MPQKIGGDNSSQKPIQFSRKASSRCWLRAVSLMLCGSFGVCLISPSWAGVQTITSGNSLALSCQRALVAVERGLETLPAADQNDAFLCMAYLGGIMAATRHANELAKLRFAQATNGRGSTEQFNLYCIDWQLSYQRVAHIVLEYARRHPELGKRPAQDLVMRALQSAYPCRK